MPKFSIIVPVYNVEKYIKKCLDSIFDQSFKDFEVIVVNDGTKDDSMKIVNNYNVIVVNQENKGLSEARNNGVKKAKGEYIIFIDSDDFIEKDLLKEINKSTNNNPDLIRYQIKDVIDQEVIEYKEKEYNDLDGNEAFKIITGFHYVEPACLYAFKRSFYIENKFTFKKGTYHEDFGLIPLIILKSNKVNIIKYCGYCYVKRSDSIMTNTDYNKTIKKVDDLFTHYDYLIEEGKKTKKDTSFYNSFISNSLIMKVADLKGKEYKKYKMELDKRKVFDNLLNDTKSRKIKKSLVKISPKVYYKVKGRD
jgi:glycosyltransferase involved in cell wall biosynthesis